MAESIAFIWTNEYSKALITVWGEADIKWILEEKTKRNQVAYQKYRPSSPTILCGYGDLSQSFDELYSWPFNRLNRSSVFIRIIHEDRNCPCPWHYTLVLSGKSNLLDMLQPSGTGRPRGSGLRACAPPPKLPPAHKPRLSYLLYASNSKEE